MKPITRTARINLEFTEDQFMELGRDLKSGGAFRLEKNGVAGMLDSVGLEVYRAAQKGKNTPEHRTQSNEESELDVASLIRQRDTLAHALKHWDDAAREAGLTYDAVRSIVNDIVKENISFGRGVELLRSLARVAAEKMKNTEAVGHGPAAGSDAVGGTVGHE